MASEADTTGTSRSISSPASSAWRPDGQGQHDGVGLGRGGDGRRLGDGDRAERGGHLVEALGALVAQQDGVDPVGRRELTGGPGADRAEADDGYAHGQAARSAQVRARELPPAAALGRQAARSPAGAARRR